MYWLKQDIKEKKHVSCIRYRVITVILCLLLTPVLTGADILDVGIKGSDKGPLVDLSQIIRTGGTFMPNDMAGKSNEEGEVIEASAPDAPATTSSVDSVSVNVKTDAEIKIVGRDIYIDNTLMPGEKTIRSRLEYFKKNSITVSVDDSYAELYARKQLYELMDEIGVKR